MIKKHWNYRIMKYPEGECGIHEVHYENNKPVSWTENPIIVSENKKGLLKVLKMIENDILKPGRKILKYKTNLTP